MDKKYDVVVDGLWVGLFSTVDKKGKECIGMFSTKGLTTTDNGNPAAYPATYQEVHDKVLEWSKDFPNTYYVAMISLDNLETIKNGQVV